MKKKNKLSKQEITALEQSGWFIVKNTEKKFEAFNAPNNQPFTLDLSSHAEARKEIGMLESMDRLMKNLGIQ